MVRSGFKVCTLNTWGLPFPIAVHPRRLRYPRIGTFLREGGFDLVALQEVWRGAPRLRVDGFVAADSAAGDAGLALVTSLPVRDVTMRHYRSGRGTDALKKKGVMAATVGDGIRVLNTHLQAGPKEKPAAVRALQVEELLEEVAAWDGPLIVLGDLNLSERTETDRSTVAALSGAGLVDTGTAATARWGSSRLDRILVRGLPLKSCEALRHGLPFLSDHLPVVAEVELD